MICGRAFRILLLLPLAACVLVPLACAPKTRLPVAAEEKPAHYDWYNYELAKKQWTEGDTGWKEKKQAPSTGYTADQKYMILLRKPKPETWRHERDLVSEMIWAREKSRNK